MMLNKVLPSFSILKTVLGLIKWVELDDDLYGICRN